jgi:hypothetical protein
MASQKGDLDVHPSPASQAKVRIAPGGGKLGGPPSLTFCYEDTSVYDPQISRIRVAHVGGNRRVYEIAAIGDAWLWGKWLVGTVPPGFRLVEGDRLEAGVYEVYVDASVGEGALRVSIDNRGSVTSLPRDEFDTTYAKTCELTGRTVPRIIPKADSGEEGPLEKLEKERRGSHLYRQK